MGNADELWESMRDLWEEWMTAKIESMIEDFDWTHDDMTPANIIAKLGNEMVEERLDDYYNSFHPHRHRKSFHDWALEWAEASMDSLGY